MCDVMIPVLDAPVRVPAAASDDRNPATLLPLYREVLETMRLTINRCAHPSCACCHELAAVLDDYLIA